MCYECLVLILLRCRITVPHAARNEQIGLALCLATTISGPPTLEQGIAWFDRTWFKGEMRTPTH